jgi:ubiquinone/menaquinone biosynthesis C-methylase UbiE
MHLINHYQKRDPHTNIARSKKSFFNSVLDHLSDSKVNNKIMLDVGCGYGYFLDMAAKRGWRTHGVEIVSDAVYQARKILGEKNIFNGVLKEAYFQGDHFDVVTLWDVLVFVEDPFEELTECYRIMKRGGKIGIRVRNVLFQKMIYRFYLPFKGIALRLKLKNPYVFHRYCFSPQSIYQLLHRAGFKNIQINNSPLTAGDPYQHSKIKSFIWLSKHFVHLISQIVFKISNGERVIGPSLLIWAEKP